MGIDERIRQHQQQHSDDDAVTAAGDVFLVLAAASIFSLILPILSNVVQLGNIILVVTIIMFVASGIGLSLLAVSDWDASDYGLELGIVVLLPVLYAVSHYGSWSLFWVGSALMIATTAGWHIWVGIRARNDAPDIPAPSQSVAMLLMIGLVGILLFRLGDFLSPLMIQEVYTLTTAIGLIVAGYAIVRQVGIISDTTIAWLAVACLGFWIFAAFLTQPQYRQFGTDAILFGQYGADLVLDGVNPYAHSMAPAFDRYAIDLRYVTYRIDGSIVYSYSYPGGSILLFTFAEVIGLPNINWLSLVVLGFTTAYLVAEADGPWKFASIGIIIACQEYVMFSSGGVFDIMYVFPLLIGMKYWKMESYHRAAFAVGFAFSVKQIPWLIGPFVAIWIYKRHSDLSALREHVTTTLGYGFAGFLLPNLPFLTHPGAWLKGVVTPVAGGAPLTSQGVTLTSLVTHNILYLPRQYFLALVTLVYALSIALYYIWYDRVKWMAWILPAVILFFHYRSLLNYYIYTPIIAYYAILLRHDLTTSHNLRKRLSSLMEMRV